MRMGRYRNDGRSTMPETTQKNIETVISEVMRLSGPEFYEPLEKFTNEHGYTIVKVTKKHSMGRPNTFITFVFDTKGSLSNMDFGHDY